VKQRIGILSPCLVMMSYLIANTVIADAAAEFSHVSISVVQMLVTLPSLLCLVFSLVVGILARKFDKKTLITASMATYVLGGVLPILFNGNIWILLFFSAVLGAGMGGLVTSTAAIICDYYEGAERSRMLGFQAAA